LIYLFKGNFIEMDLAEVVSFVRSLIKGRGPKILSVCSPFSHPVRALYRSSATLFIN
jgi:hypothetical protein